jgi:hydrogenase/urease accessory protein HupE
VRSGDGRQRGSTTGWLCTFLALAAALFFPRPAAAHAVGLSKGAYVAAGSEVTAELTFSPAELARSIPTLDRDEDGTIDEAELARGHDTLGSAVLGGLAVRSQGAPCAGSMTSTSVTEQDGVLVRVQFSCAAPVSDLRVKLSLLDLFPHGHRHIAHAEIGSATQDDVLFRGHDELELRAAAPAPGQARVAAPAPRFTSFLRMGIEHILTGYDHLVFLFGLVLVGGRVRALVAVITAFTLAHSITLALAALDVYSPPSRVVEAGIALSIAYVGIENFFVANAERRWRITFPFGLIHGFGFAGALREVSLDRAQVPLALLGFNLGVEAGQLAVLAVVLPLVLGLRKKGVLGRRATLALSAAVAAAGIVWFAMRVRG